MQTYKQRQRTKRAAEEAIELPTSSVSDDLLTEADRLLAAIEVLLEG